MQPRTEVGLRSAELYERARRAFSWDFARLDGLVSDPTYRELEGAVLVRGSDDRVHPPA